jgi:hypothetical protein
MRQWLWRIMPSVLFALLLQGCLSSPEEKYDAAVKKEVAELLKLYRLCLQKNEDNPTKAKENCAPYREAIQDLAPPDQRNSIGRFLERLLGKTDH